MRGDRAANARRAGELRAEGLLQREIAEEMGLGRGYVSSLLADPEGIRDRERKRQYEGECERCGGPTTGGDGPRNTPRHCAACASEIQTENRYWTTERVLERFRDFYRETGRSPAVTDKMAGNPSVRRHLSDARIREAEAVTVVLPAPSIVARECGSWEAALEAAGLPANSPGGEPSHRSRQTDSKGRAMRTYHVLHRNSDGSLDEQHVEALTPEQAIERIADGEGTWIAVLDRDWCERSTEAKQIFAVVQP